LAGDRLRSRFAGDRHVASLVMLNKSLAKVNDMADARNWSTTGGDLGVRVKARRGGELTHAFPPSA
ncbi:MAG: hypothetical protein ABR922_21365, partial [Streptosporangiaceae bacterium]